MKRLALLSVVSLMLVSAIFAPVAMAQVPGEIDVQSVTLGPGGSVTVTGTIQCVEGQQYEAYVTVRQRTSGNIILRGDVQASGICPTTGPVTFTGTTFGRTGQDSIEKPFHKGRASVQTFGRICAPEGFPCEPAQQSSEEVRIR
jgi:hypothetical protein